MHNRQKRDSASETTAQPASKRRLFRGLSFFSVAGEVARVEGAVRVTTDMAVSLPPSVTTVELDSWQLEDGVITALLNSPNITSIMFGAHNILTPSQRRELDSVGSSTTLTALHSDHMRLMEEELAAISKCLSLKHFSMRYRIINPPTVQALLRLPSLTSLVLSTLDTEGAKTLAGSSVTSLDVRCHSMCPDGFEALASAKQLRKLIIGGINTKRNVYEVRLLARSSSLQHLKLAHGLAKYAALEQLEISSSLLTVSTEPAMPVPLKVQLTLSRNGRNLLYDNLVALQELRFIPTVLLRMFAEYAV